MKRRKREEAEGKMQPMAPPRPWEVKEFQGKRD